MASDAVCADVLACALREAGAQVRLIDPSGLALARLGAFDPQVLLCEQGQDLRFLRERIVQHPLMRWVSTLSLPWSEIWRPGLTAPHLGLLVHAALPMLEAEWTLRRTVRGVGQRFEVSLEHIGPVRALRMLCAERDLFRIHIAGLHERGTVELAGDLVVGATFELRGFPPITGLEAFSRVLELEGTRAFIERRIALEQPTLSMPFEQALDLALADIRDRDGSDVPTLRMQSPLALLESERPRHEKTKVVRYPLQARQTPPPEAPTPRGTPMIPRAALLTPVSQTLDQRSPPSEPIVVIETESESESAPEPSPHDAITAIPPPPGASAANAHGAPAPGTLPIPEALRAPTELEPTDPTARPPSAAPPEVVPEFPLPAVPGGDSLRPTARTARTGIPRATRWQWLGLGAGAVVVTFMAMLVAESVWQPEEGITAVELDPSTASAQPLPTRVVAGAPGPKPPEVRYGPKPEKKPAPEPAAPKAKAPEPPVKVQAARSADAELDTNDASELERAVRQALDRNDPERAVAAAERLVALEPNRARVRVLYGDALRAAGKNHAALAQYRIAAQRAPRSPMVRARLEKMRDL